MLGQEAVPDKANELVAIPALLARSVEQNGQRRELVPIDAIATNANIAIATTLATARRSWHGLPRTMKDRRNGEFSLAAPSGHAPAI